MTAHQAQPNPALVPHGPDSSPVAELRRQLIKLAASGHRMPIGTDLVLHEQADPQAVLCDARRLGEVMIAAARRYATPLALPIMDLRLEKSDLLQRLGVSADEVDQFHFSSPPTDEQIAKARSTEDAPFDRRGQANLDAIAHASRNSDLIACGMAIGPFSLMTKLLGDPITAVAMAGMGLTAEDEPDVAMVERAMILACGAVRRSLAAQARAGARAVCICEPAANIMFLSPNMIASGSDIFERFVMQPNLQLARQLNDAHVGLIFHDCGELLDDFVAQFAHRLHPVMLSLGSSRELWLDAKLVPDDVVMYGNLPSKRFYSDSELSVDAVQTMTCQLLSKMKKTGKPFILGSECDVLSVSGCHDLIAGKVQRMLSCQCH